MKKTNKKIGVKVKGKKVVSKETKKPFTKKPLKEKKFYTALKQGSRFNVIQSLNKSKQVFLVGKTIDSEKIGETEVKLYGKKDKLKNLTPFKLYIPINRDTHNSMKAVLGLSIEVLEKQGNKATKYKIVKYTK